MLVGATVHFPYMTASPDKAAIDHRLATQEGFRELGALFKAARIDTLIAITSEHIVNLQPRMAPAFVVGTGTEHRAFPEPHFNLAPLSRRGDSEFAQELVRSLYEQGFDPAHSSELRLDHGTTLPLAQIELPPDIAVVPIVVNSIFPPLPTLARCRAMGTGLAGAIARSRLGRRVALLATGGISHTVGDPHPERNDTAFDLEFLDALRRGDLDRACAFSDEVLDRAGNGTHEIRNWIVAAAVAVPNLPRVITSLPYVPGWDSGVHQMVWEG